MPIKKSNMIISLLHPFLVFQKLVPFHPLKESYLFQTARGVKLKILQREAPCEGSSWLCRGIRLEAQRFRSNESHGDDWGPCRKPWFTMGSSPRWSEWALASIAVKIYQRLFTSISKTGSGNEYLVRLDDNYPFGTPNPNDQSPQKMNTPRAIYWFIILPMSERPWDNSSMSPKLER